MNKLTQPNLQSSRSSTLHMKSDYTYTDFLKKPIHLTCVNLEKGRWVKLLLKSKSGEKVLAEMRDSAPKVFLDVDIHCGDQLSIESNGYAFVTLVGCLRELEYGKDRFRMEDCFIATTKWFKCEIQTNNPFA